MLYFNDLQKHILLIKFYLLPNPKDYRQTECVDLKPTKLCERRKARSICQRFPNWATKNCQLTCDVCTTRPTTEPISNNI